MWNFSRKKINSIHRWQLCFQCKKKLSYKWINGKEEQALKFDYLVWNLLPPSNDVNLNKLLKSLSLIPHL